MKRWMLLLIAVVSLSLQAYEFLILGDTHYDSKDVRLPGQKLTAGRARELDRNLTRWQSTIPALLKAAGARSAQNIDFVVQLGDLTQGDCGARELQEKAFRDAVAVISKEMKAPFYAVKGNHDIRGEGAQEAYINVMIPYLEKMLKTPPAAENTGNFVLKHKKDLFFLFDSIRPDLAHVEKALAENPDVRYVFFLTHLPVLPCSGGSPAWIVFGKQSQNAERQKLLSLLAKHHAIVLTAHIHRSTLFRYQGQEGTITQLSTFSMPDGNNADIAVKKFDPNGFFKMKSYLKGVKSREDAAEVMQDFLGKYITRWEMTPAAGYNVLRVTDDGVNADFYSSNSQTPIRTVRLLQK